MHDYTAPEHGAAITELVINACTLALGAWTGVRGWRTMKSAR